MTVTWSIPETGDASLHIYGIPGDLLRNISKYNREDPGPRANAINITMTCVEALEKELERRGIT